MIQFDSIIVQSMSPFMQSFHSLIVSHCNSVIKILDIQTIKGDTASKKNPISLSSSRKRNKTGKDENHLAIADCFWHILSWVLQYFSKRGKSKISKFSLLFFLFIIIYIDLYVFNFHTQKKKSTPFTVGNQYTADLWGLHISTENIKNTSHTKMLSTMYSL